MTRQPTIAAIILAAGLSRRMGAFKPLMKLGDRTVLERVVRLYADGGVDDLRVVVGHRAEALRRTLQSHPVTIVHNPRYTQGMYTSVQCGVASLDERIDAFFIHPADMPLVRPHTINRLRQAFETNPALVTCPVFDAQPGHPPLIHRDAIPAILAHDGRGGLRSVLTRYEAATQPIPVADQGILLDLDTPDDAVRLAARQADANILTTAECRVLMATVLRLPEPVITHCQCVAQVAVAMAEAVNDSGVPVDIDLVNSAALVHDAAKGRSGHAAAAADRLARMGFAELAAVVAVHMDIAVNDDQPLDAAQIVYLADKLVQGNTPVDLDRRFAAALARYGNHPDAADAVIRRRTAAERIRTKVEHATGRLLADIVGQAALMKAGKGCEPC